MSLFFSFTMYSNSKKFSILKSLFCTKNIRTVKRSLILGIESTFDDTGAAVVNSHGELIGECLITQSNELTKTGGVDVWHAQDFHRQYLPVAVNNAMKDAGIEYNDLSALATATKPGMYLCLKEGLEFSKKLITHHHLPFIPINHMEAHLLTARMSQHNENEYLDFPFLTLLVSGGHCLLVAAKELGSYDILGKCLDKPPGAAIDRIARCLSPCDGNEMKRNGFYLEKLAENGDSEKFELPVPMNRNGRKNNYSCDFSFSGLLSNTQALINKENDIEHPNIAASFQKSLSSHLCRQTSRAISYCQLFDKNFSKNRTLVVSGGVACNSYIRSKLKKVCDDFNWRLICPPPKLCTDNGVMIAWTGYEYWKRQKGFSKDPLNEKYQAKCDIGSYIRNNVIESKIKTINY